MAELISSIKSQRINDETNSKERRLHVAQNAAAQNQLKEQIRKIFGSFQKKVSIILIETRSYLKTCLLLKIDSATQKIDDRDDSLRVLILKPGQITKAAGIQDQEDTTIQKDVIADDYEIGKII